MALLAALAFAMGSPIFEGRLLDTDAYSYANRVTELRADGDWFDDTVDRVSPPDGHKQHWSRPLDAILLSGAMVLEPFFGFTDALFAWAVLTPVLLGIGTLAVLWRGFAWQLGGTGRLALPILFATSIPILTTYAAGRADHQALIGLLMAVLLVQASNMLGPAEVSTRASLTFGATAGLGFWVGVESLVIVGLVFAALCLAWVARARVKLVRVVEATFAWAAVSAIALFVENGPEGWTRRDLDELSVVFVSLPVVMGAALLLLRGTESYGWQGHRATRFVSLVVVFSLALAVMFLAFPELSSPAGNIDPLYRDTRLQAITEVQAIYDGGARSTLARGALTLALLPAALLGARALLRSRKHDPGDLERWLPVLFGAAFFSCYTVIGVKFAGPAAIAMVPLAALGLDRWEVRLGRRATVGAVLVAALWWVPALWAFGLPESEAALTACDTKAAAEQLADPAGLGSEARLILTSADAGPELLYRTPHSVFSIPNHRFQPGYTMAVNVMMARSDAEAQVAFDVSKADNILVCSTSASEWESDRDTFYKRLTSGSTPAWLVELPLTESAGDFRLFGRAGA